MRNANSRTIPLCNDNKQVVLIVFQLCLKARTNREKKLIVNSEETSPEPRYELTVYSWMRPS